MQLIDLPRDRPDDEPKLSVGSPREFRVVTLLSAEEYLALTHLCERDGLSQSAFIRMLLRRRMESAADAAQDVRGSDKPASA